MAALRVGTCSWKYPSWKGLVYSASKDINFLEEYARRYETVEVDQWFWSLFGDGEVRLPRQADVLEYCSSVGSDFRFSIKVPNGITLTHYYRKRKSDPLEANPHFLSPDLWKAFISRIDPLADVMGPLMLQFEYLNRDKMRSQEQFQQQLGTFLEAIPRSGTVGVEVRNAQYLNPRFFDFLLGHGAIPVLLQGYWMPPIADVYQQWRDRIVTHATVVLRLHGGDRKQVEERSQKRWNKIVTPRDEELAGIASVVADLLDNDVDVYLNVNNHYEGSAPMTIERVLRFLRV